MKKRFLIFAFLGLLSFVGAAQTQLSWRLANFEVQNAGAELHFDVQVKANTATTYYRDLQVYLDYNTAGFGSSIVSGGHVTVTPGPLMDNFYSFVNVVDNTSSKFAIIIEADNEFSDVGSASAFNMMPTTYSTLCHIVMDVVDNTVVSGIAFDEVLMNGGQYYQLTSSVAPAKYADPSIFTDDFTNVILSTAYGTITYASASATPIQNCTVNIVGQGNTISNAAGEYYYTGLADGNYTITTSCSEPYTYVTDLGDLNVVLDHIGGTPLTGIYFLAGDVDGNSIIDLSDFNLMLDNIGGAVVGYPINDWLFIDQNVTVTNGVGTVNYQGIMAGDADGSN